MNSKIKEKNNAFLIRCSLLTDIESKTIEAQAVKKAYQDYTVYLYKEGEN